ncbi:hypothetical protein ZPAH1_orf00194 [Aeromonas phage ZPAH1]|nr:hypothetical protein ASwh1_145 [Aeromonas phage Aswh_1]QQG33956.1 hypothetical protein ZPAH1_orf00194 [Aeromonas phage ZPAH1]
MHREIAKEWAIKHFPISPENPFDFNKDSWFVRPSIENSCRVRVSSGTGNGNLNVELPVIIGSHLTKEFFEYIIGDDYFYTKNVYNQYIVYRYYIVADGSRQAFYIATKVEDQSKDTSSYYLEKI